MNKQVMAMILAAGKGTRMRPLTDNCPKPLLMVSDKPLIEWHLQKLKAAGVSRVVVNCAYFADKVEAYFSARPDDGLEITVINEGDEPLETAGGIVNAMRYLGDEPFLVVNGDVWIEFDYSKLVQKAKALKEQGLLVLVQNPEHNPKGDFAVDPLGMLKNLTAASVDDTSSYTFSGVSILSPALFEALSISSGALGPFLRQWIDQSLLEASVFDGYWLDVGTPERLSALEDRLLAVGA